MSFWKKKYTAIIGFPSYGIMPNSIIDWISRQVKIDDYLAYFSKEVPPVSFFYEENYLMPIRCYLSREKKLIFLVSDVFISYDSMYELSMDIVSMLRRMGARRFYFIFDAAVSSIREGMFYGYNSDEAREWLMERGRNKYVKNANMSGIISYMFMRNTIENIPSVILFVETERDFHVEQINNALREVCDFFNLTLNTSEYERETERIQREMLEVSKRIQEEREQKEMVNAGMYS